MGFYDTPMLDALEKVCIHFPDTLSKVTDTEDSRMWLSLRWGVITKAGGQKVCQHIIDLLGRSRKIEAARGMEPGLLM